MTRRVVSVWLPLLATERARRGGCAPRDEAIPFATVAAIGNARRLAAVDGAARRAGLRAGMSVADSRALAPDLALAPADPAADRALLERLAGWCGRFTPWTATDSWEEGAEGFGLWLDVTGCAHLFGGEAGLLARLTGELGRLGFAARAALADTPGAAWAWARFGDGARPVLEPATQQDALAPLPIACLRLSSAAAATLSGLGLRRMKDLYGVPRAGLGLRFGREVARRLDQALGREPEPVSPRRPPPSHSLDAAFAEPISRPEDVAEAARRLLVRLCRRLGEDGLGLRRLEAAAFRVDSSARAVAIGTGRPSRDADHLLRLLERALEGLDPGFGIEILRLSALEVAPLPAEQTAFARGAARGEGLGRLLDSLGNRLGFDRLARLVPRESHMPERAVRAQPPDSPLPPVHWPNRRRPLRLFPRPEPIEAMAPLPDAPPLSFRWRNNTHRVVRAEDAERIGPEWWRKDEPERDYYLVEDERGRRFWLYRAGPYGGPAPPRWYLHGVFA